MCGIIAVLSPAELSAQITNEAEQALDALAHRGPDDSGVFSDDVAFLGHRRLSILDLSEAGHQPMSTADGSITLVFNGQIYNWQALRDELSVLGHDFHSQCDTEVVLRGYLEWGKGLFSKLVGMWAIVVWDGKTRNLTISRDRLGIKPLYLRKLSGGEIAFASEIKALSRFDHGLTQLDDLTVKRYLCRGWLDDVPGTLYNSVISVPAASVITVDRYLNFHVERFWDYPIPHRICDDVQMLRQTFVEAVERHVQSDAPLATTLSGGIDSTAINSVMVRELGMVRDVNAFSVMAPDIADESELIDKTVNDLGIRHQYVRITEDEYVEAIDKLLLFHDEPTFSAGQVNQFIFREKIAEQGYKVLLTGDGADEIFAGYAKIFPMYLSSLLDAGERGLYEKAILLGTELVGRPMAEIEQMVAKYRLSGSGGRTQQEYRYGYELFNEQHRPYDSRLNFAKSHDQLRFLTKGHDLFRELLDRMKVDIPQVLRNEDRNGMAHSLEVRPVFLDHLVFEQAWKYPFEMFMADGENKSVLRQALKGIIPEHVLNNKKKFVRPGSVRHLVYKVLSEKIIEVIDKNTSKHSIWREDLLEEYFLASNEGDVHKALVWFRFYLLNRLMDLRGLSL